MAARDEVVVRLRADGAQQAGQQIATVERSMGRLERSGRAVGRSLVSVGKIGASALVGLGAAATTLAGTAIGVGIKTAAGMEQAQISFTTMLGSAEKAKSFLADLNAFAAKTPFDLPGLQTAASSLVSAGIEASKVIPIMTSLGNATSGMGTGAEGVQRATVALQQMNAAGRITGEDLNQLRDAGIPVFDLLAAATGKSVKQVAALAQAGKLGSKELEQLMGALESGKGLERFNGLMAAQSQSMTGLWSTLKDTFSVGMAQAIQPLVPLIKSGLSGAIEKVSGFMPRLNFHLRGFIAGLRDGHGPITGHSGALNTLGLGLRALVGAFKDGNVTSGGFVGGMERVGVGAGKAVAFVKDLWANVSGREQPDAEKGSAILAGVVGAAQALLSVVPSLTGVLEIGAAAFKLVADNADTIIKYLPLLIGLILLMKVGQAAANIAALASLPIRAAEVVATLALASANRALAFQLGVLTGVQRVSIFTRIASTAATVGNTLAIVALTVASWALSAVVGIITAAQWLWNAAMLANPVGLVIVGIALLVGGLVLLYKKSETARTLMNAFFDALKVGVGNLAGIWLQAVRGMLWVWLTVVDGIVSGAAKALGWVPGLGDKLKAANTAFDNMKDGILTTLDSAAQKAYGFGEKTAANLAAGAAAGPPVVFRTAAGQASVGAKLDRLAGERAGGGPVRAFQPYLVGEQGPEIIRPARSGVVMTAQETAALMATRPLPPRDEPMVAAQQQARVVTFEAGAIVIHESGDPRKTLQAVRQALSDKEADA